MNYYFIWKYSSKNNSVYYKYPKLVNNTVNINLLQAFKYKPSDLKKT